MHCIFKLSFWLLSSESTTVKLSTYVLICLSNSLLRRTTGSGAGPSNKKDLIFIVNSLQSSDDNHSL
jgi:hypothetical protein